MHLSKLGTEMFFPQVVCRLLLGIETIVHLEQAIQYLLPSEQLCRLGRSPVSGPGNHTLCATILSLTWPFLDRFETPIIAYRIFLSPAWTCLVLRSDLVPLRMLHLPSVTHHLGSGFWILDSRTTEKRASGTGHTAFYLHHSC